MAQEVYASTYMAGVLEHAGYIAQAKLLEEFMPLFTSLGGLIFFIAVAGALTSIAIFGSYRAGAYILIGPVIFWTLIMPRTDVASVVWKQGSRVERTIGGVASSESIQNVNKAADQEIKVAAVFQHYTSIISRIVNEITKVILQFSDDEDLFFMSRPAAMEMLLNAQVTDSRLMGMFKNALFGGNQDATGRKTDCAEFMNAALVAAAPAARGTELAEFEQDFQRHSQNGLLDPNSGTFDVETAERLLADAAKLRGAKEYYRDLFDKVSSVTRVVPNKDTISFIQDYKTLPQVGAVLQAHGLSSGASDAEIKDYFSSNSMSCGEMWNVIERGVYKEATEEMQDILSRFEKGWENDPETSQKFCVALARKLGRDVDLQTSDTDGPFQSGECDLVPYAFMMLVRNTLEPNSLAEIAQKVKNESYYLQLSPAEGFKALSDEQGNRVEGPWVARLDEPLSSTDRRVGLFKPWEGKQVDIMLFAKDGFKGPCNQDAFQKGDCQWMTFHQLGSGDDHFTASQHQRVNEAIGYRGRIHAYATELPYWQGVILYILGMMYPLWAFVVLVPGRAAGFMLMPLMWLWAKSWDIGFALVGLFERVLSNMMPNMALPYRNLENASVRDLPLPDLIAEAFKIDPFYHVHTYYFVMDLAVLSIPAITASIILKSRKSILESFTEGAPGNSSQGAGTIGNEYRQSATQASGMQGMNLTQQDMRETDGAGRLGFSSLGEGILGNGRAEEYAAMAAAKGGTSLARNTLGGYLDKIDDNQAYTPANFLGNISSAMKTGKDQAKSIFHSELDYEKAYATVYDRQTGRWAGSQTQADAVHAALDGGGGFEINNRRTFLYKDFAAKERARLIYDYELEEDLTFLRWRAPISMLRGKWRNIGAGAGLVTGYAFPSQVGGGRVAEDLYELDALMDYEAELRKLNKMEGLNETEEDWQTRDENLQILEGKERFADIKAGQSVRSGTIPGALEDNIDIDLSSYLNPTKTKESLYTILDSGRRSLLGTNSTKGGGDETP